jgi:glycine oxidase
VTALLSRIASLAPAGLAAPITRLWAGLRPWAPDGPIVGRMPGTTNLVLACGHYRSGVLLAPITAAMVAAAVAGEPPPPDVGAFLPPPGTGA